MMVLFLITQFEAGISLSSDDCGCLEPYKDEVTLMLHTKPGCLKSRLDVTFVFMIVVQPITIDAPVSAEVCWKAAIMVFVLRTYCSRHRTYYGRLFS
ncbi:hypothetical protein TNCV_78231 [Trichonephila clavipes]|nr:hypothetical protein TNCV_78231 [Trichonephila clavipes]